MSRVEWEGRGGIGKEGMERGGEGWKRKDE